MPMPTQITVPVSTQPQPLHLTPARQFQGIASVAVTPNGYIWATWYSGGVTEGPENFVVLVVSTDGGDTWSDTIAVVAPPGNVRAYDPVNWVDPLGRLWLFWSQCTSQRDHNIFDGYSGVWGSYTEDWQSATPQTWSTPIRFANGIMMNKPIVLANGTWAYPTAVWNNHGGGTVDPELLPEKFSNIVLSTDQGQTYTRLGGADVPERAFDEHMIVERRDGSLWMLVRTFYGIGQSVSTDGGRTWTPGEDSGLGGPNSRFHIRRLKSGRLLLINHHVDPEKPRQRYQLFATLSDDDGATWHGELMLDERVGVSYPDADETDDGCIYAIHDHQRYKEGEIILSAFREADILAGHLVSDGAYLKRVVNRSGGVPESKAT